jgi:phosphoglycolate phosphatase-like HAD superfamily hydrolase
MISKEVFLFTDFDDTLSCQADLTEEYIKELCQLLPREIAGGDGDWERAVRRGLSNSLNRYKERYNENASLTGYREWIKEERARALLDACKVMNLSLKTSETPSELASRLQFEALTACNAAFPEAYDTLQRLFEMGVRIQLASSQESDYLLAALIGAGIESFTESKFGPDLVDCAKEGPEFYRRITSAIGANPRDSIVLDDQLRCLLWAKEAGIENLIWLRNDTSNSAPEGIRTIRSLHELPDIIGNMMNQ